MTDTDFNTMVVRHEQVLQPYAISLTRSQEDAKDLYQETMLRALLYKDKYRLGTNLKAWLYTIMRNIFINNYRRNKKYPTVDVDALQGTGPYHAGQTTQNACWSRLRMEELKTALESLPQMLRLVFELYYTGYKYQEIADLLQEPLGTIKSRIHFARKTLAARIEIQA